MRVLITGTAGFIGFHLARRLLDEGHVVHGYDGMTDYYDVRLKQRRHQILLQNEGFSATEGMLEDDALFQQVADAFEPDVIVHLAAQAGVRYSLENPRAYIEANVVGTFNDGFLYAGNLAYLSMLAIFPFFITGRRSSPRWAKAANARRASMRSRSPCLRWSRT